MTDFWKRNGRFGTLREMMYRSLRERVTERLPGAAQQDNLSEAKAIEGLERVGAALVFSRRRGIELPDADPAVDPESDAADLALVLPDWSSAERGALLRRAALEPGPLGTVQLHNDNNGTVRAYLAASWLHRLRREKNLSIRHLCDLLFSETYDLPVVRPSLRETAAWLSIEVDAVAKEIVARDPMLLLSMGDPQSLSAAWRKRALEAVCVQILASQSFGLLTLSHDALKRFAQPDLIPTILALWDQYATSGDVRTLLVQLIWLGKLDGCLELVESVAISSDDVPLAQRSMAARAYVTAADEKRKKAFSKFIVAHPTRFHISVTWEMAAALHPAHISVDDLTAMVEQLQLKNEDFASELESVAALLIEQMSDAATLHRFLESLLRVLGGEPGDPEGPYDYRDEALVKTIALVSQKLLSVSPTTEAPQAVIDAVLRTGHRQSGERATLSGVISALHSSHERRRIALWRVYDQLQGHQYLHAGNLEYLWQMRVLGYDADIRQDDIEWLLLDARERPTDDQKCFALNTALSLWRDAGSPDELIVTIEAAASGNERLMSAIAEARKPPTPNPEVEKVRHRSREIERRNAAQRAAHDEKWIRFFDEVKNNPDQLRNARQTTAEGADAKLYHLWELLRGSDDGNSRHSMSSMGSLGELLGPTLSTNFIAGLGRHWRAWKPKLYSQKAQNMRNESSALDLMGVAGISLEAAKDPRWAEKLPPDEAERASQYSTLELNGTPTWLTDLVRSHPRTVEQVYLGELQAQLNEGPTDGRYAILGNLSRAPDEVQDVIAAGVLANLIDRPDLGPDALNPMLGILRDAAKRSASLAEELRQVVRQRFNESDDEPAAVNYLATLFVLDTVTATQALVEKLERQTCEQKKIDFLISLLPQIVVGRWQSPDSGTWLPFDSLLRIVIASHRVLKPQDDPEHQGVYSPSPHDDAVDSRDRAFKLLVETPGRATYAALWQLSQNPDFPYPPSRMLELARERAEKDSELEPWPLSEPEEYEKSLHFAPATTKGLHEMAVNRLRDFQHDLIHSDFAQAPAVRLLGDEKAVQKWIADRFALTSNRSYTVERESHVANEKEPDIRLRSRQTGSSVPIEVKVAESWTYAQLKTALTTQLCGQYLRHAEARQGILLLVHKEPRPMGWQRPGETDFLSFAELVADLRAIAASLCAESPTSPQPSVEVLDASGA